MRGCKNKDSHTGKYYDEGYFSVRVRQIEPQSLCENPKETHNSYCHSSILEALAFCLGHLKQTWGAHFLSERIIKWI